MRSNNLSVPEDDDIGKPVVHTVHKMTNWVNKSEKWKSIWKGPSSKSSAYVHDEGRIGTPGTCSFNIHYIYLY